MCVCVCVCVYVCVPVCLCVSEISTALEESIILVWLLSSCEVLMSYLTPNGLV